MFAKATFAKVVASRADNDYVTFSVKHEEVKMTKFEAHRGKRDHSTIISHRREEFDELADQ